MLLNKAADAGAATGADCLVSIGCGMAFGAVNRVLGFDGSTSAIFGLTMNAQAEARCRSQTGFAEEAARGTGRD